MNSAKKSRRVGVLIETNSSWSRSLIAGIIEFSKQHSPWDLYLDPLSFDELRHLQDNWHGDGVIARVATPSILQTLRELGLPVVNVSSIQLEECDYPRVITSPMAQAKLAYDAFRFRGFQQFAYIGDAEVEYIKRHCEAYEGLLAEHGHELIVHCPESIDAIRSWLRKLPKPIGVYCWGSHWGNRIINACTIEQIRVPHDVAVLGSNYDDVLNEASFPSQAGILMNPRHIGELAASILDRLMDGQSIEKSQWLLEPIKVVERQSIDTLAVADDRVRDVIHYLNQNATKPIAVDDAVAAVPVPRRTLERRFRKYIGCSIGDYIRQLRVNHARELLAGTNLTMAAISDACGFSSYNYFTRVFRQVVGIPPSQYRKEWKTLTS